MHQARVATRRLREAVPILATGLKHSKAGKASRKIRRLTRALGTVRELDVTLGLLQGLIEAGELPRTALEEVRAHVVAERDRRRAVMLERLNKVDPQKLDRRLMSVGEALDGSDDEGWREVLSDRLRTRAKRLEQAIEAAGQIYAPERLHQARIAAKKLRYGVELAADSGTRAAGPLLAPLKKAQDVLGHLHDLQILQALVADVQTEPAADRPGMHDALDRVALHLEDQCRHLHGQYLMSSARLLEICEQIRTRLAAEVALRPSRRPLKMSLRRAAAEAAGGGRR